MCAKGKLKDWRGQSDGALAAGSAPIRDWIRVWFRLDSRRVRIRTALGPCCRAAESTHHQRRGHRRCANFPAARPARL